jgi:hypothetical protein
MKTLSLLCAVSLGLGISAVDVYAQERVILGVVGSPVVATAVAVGATVYVANKAPDALAAAGASYGRWSDSRLLSKIEKNPTGFLADEIQRDKQVTVKLNRVKKVFEAREKQHEVIRQFKRNSPDFNPDLYWSRDIDPKTSKVTMVEKIWVTDQDKMELFKTTLDEAFDRSNGRVETIKEIIASMQGGRIPYNSENQRKSAELTYAHEMLDNNLLGLGNGITGIDPRWDDFMQLANVDLAYYEAGNFEKVSLRTLLPSNDGKINSCPVFKIPLDPKLAAALLGNREKGIPAMEVECIAGNKKQVSIRKSQGTSVIEVTFIKKRKLNVIGCVTGFSDCHTYNYPSNEEFIQNVYQAAKSNK